MTARVVVVAAGGWVAGAAGRPACELPPLRVTEQSVFHFPRRDADAPPWPSVIHEAGGHATYHLAGGRDGGTWQRPQDRAARLRPARVAGDRAGTRRSPRCAPSSSAYVEQWLPGLEPTPRGETTCLYTITPSEDFVLDRVGPIVVCSPCSGHGAKFAPLVGELVADLVGRSRRRARPVPARGSLARGELGSVSL